MIIDQTQLKGIKGKIERVCVGESVRVCVREREKEGEIDGHGKIDFLQQTSPPGKRCSRVFLVEIPAEKSTRFERSNRWSG